METLVSRVAGNLTEDCIAERRLWIAVLVAAVEDWRDGSVRKQREAQTFLFENKKDFERVCASAGVDPNGFRSRLLHIGKKIDMRGSWNRKLVA